MSIGKMCHRFITLYFCSLEICLWAQNLNMIVAHKNCCLHAFLTSLFGFVELLADVLLGIKETAALRTNINRTK